MITTGPLNHCESTTSHAHTKPWTRIWCAELCTCRSIACPQGFRAPACVSDYIILEGSRRQNARLFLLVHPTLLVLWQDDRIGMKNGSVIWQMNNSNWQVRNLVDEELDVLLFAFWTPRVSSLPCWFSWQPSHAHNGWTDVNILDWRKYPCWTIHRNKNTASQVAVAHGSFVVESWQVLIWAYILVAVST